MIESIKTAATSTALRWAALALAAGATLAHGETTPTEPALATAQARFSAERVKLPGDEAMGLVGTSYLIGVGNDASGQGLAVGPAAYGAVSGERGGLFTVGVEGIWSQRIAGPLGAELGFYAGGGGGGNAPVGGGLMLRPHAALTWSLGGQRLGLSFSQVRFANGSISSHQFGLLWSADTEFRYVPPDALASGALWNAPAGIGFDRLQAFVGVYRPRAGATRLTQPDQALPSSIGFVGMRLERPLSENLHWGIEAAGAANGAVAGYAEYLATMSAETAVFDPRLSIGARVGLGLGGGGDVSVGGGLLAKAAVYTGYRFTRSLGLTLEGGFAQAPNGNFKAAQVLGALNWRLGEQDTDDTRSASAASPAIRTEWAAGAERYDAPRKADPGGPAHDLQAVVLRVNRFVGNQVYLTGQVHSAWGGQAGGYTAGLFGIGAELPLAPRWLASAELLAGAAGGGGVDVQGGRIVQPMARVAYALAPGTAVQLGAGAIRSWNGGLHSAVLDAAMVFAFGVR